MSWLSYRAEDGYVVGIFKNKKEMLFDYQDLENISKSQWSIDDAGYPITCREGQKVRLHRLLIQNVEKGMVVDHINRNKLDNRRCNLRICTQKENVYNTGLHPKNKSGVTGVFFDKRAKRWRAQIYHNGKVLHVGIFDDFYDAVAARKEAEEKYRKGMM